MIIITRQREALKSQKVKKDLNSILKKWKFDNQPIRNSKEFLNHFEPWITEQLESKRKLKAFLQRKGVERLEEIT